MCDASYRHPPWAHWRAMTSVHPSPLFLIRQLLSLPTNAICRCDSRSWMYATELEEFLTNNASTLFTETSKLTYTSVFYFVLSLRTQPNHRFTCVFGLCGARLKRLISTIFSCTWKRVLAPHDVGPTRAHAPARHYAPIPQWESRGWGDWRGREGRVSGVYPVIKGEEGPIVVYCTRNECLIAVLE